MIFDLTYGQFAFSILCLLIVGGFMLAMDKLSKVNNEIEKAENKFEAEEALEADG